MSAALLGALVVVVLLGAAVAVLVARLVRARRAGAVTGAAAGAAAAAPGPDEGAPAPSAPARQRTDQGLTVSGSVRRSDGQPFAGAALTLTDLSGAPVATTASDADGSYRVELPTGGSYLLIASGEQRQPSMSPVAVGDRSVVVDVVLAGTASVTGRVLRHRAPGGGYPGPDDAPVDEAALDDAALEDEELDDAGPDEGTDDAEADDAGPDEGTHDAEADDAEPEADEAADHEPQDVAPEDDDEPVGSAVAVEGAAVTLVDVRGEVLGTTTSDVRGHYAFTHLSEGACVVTAQAEGQRPVARAVRVPATGEVVCDLRLSGGGRVEGSVVAARDGSAVADASVALVDSAGVVVASTTTSGDGEYAFADLAGGAYTLMASGYPPVATTVEVGGGQVAVTRVELGRAR